MAETSGNKYFVNALAISPNYADDPNLIDQYSAGVPTYTSYDKKYIIVPGQWRQWTFNIRTFVCESPKKYNVYARCSKQGSWATTFYSLQSFPVEPTETTHKDFYFFKIGEISEIGADNKRTFTAMYGANITGPDGLAVTGPEEEIFTIDKSQDTSHDQSDRDKWLAVTDLPVISEKEFQAPVVGPMKQTKLGAADWFTDADINFRQGLQFNGKLMDNIVRNGDGDVFSETAPLSSLRSRAEFLSRLSDDKALGKLTLTKGAQFGESFVPGITGIGGLIDGKGDAEFESVIIRRFLEAPEIRFNSISVYLGDKWRAPGGGLIQSVDTLNQTVTLKLEDGQIGAIAPGDICMGIFHSWNNDDNATQDTDDSRGNRTYAGFFTTYFTITEVTGEYNNQFTYQLRPQSERWQHSFHPAAMMNFVTYGSFTNPDRQTSVYETRTYTRMLRNQNTWEISASNIAMQYGNMTNMSIHGIDTQGYSIYLNNVYFIGAIKQVKPDGSSAPLPNFLPDWKPGDAVNYYEQVSYKGGLWLCVNEDGTTTEPADGNPHWLRQVAPGNSVTNHGDWQQDKHIPYLGIVRIGKATYMCVNPNGTVGSYLILTDEADNHLTDENGDDLLSDEIDLTDFEPVATDGDDGTGIQSITTQYYLSASPTSLTGDNWSNNRPTWINGWYIWTRQQTTYTNGTTTLTEPICVTGGTGKDGAQGTDGCIMRHAEWRIGVQWRNDETLTNGTRYLDVALVRDLTLETGWQAYKCKITHESTPANAPGNTIYWEPFGLNVNAIFTSLIIAKDASIDFMQGNQLLIKKEGENGIPIVTAGLSGSQQGSKIRIWAGGDDPETANFRVDENGNGRFAGEIIASGGEFSGTLKGVSGSFQSLNCVNREGNVVGSISFGETGNIYFQGGLYHQESTLPFYASNIWARGAFGRLAPTAIVVHGVYAYVYPFGLSDNRRQQIALPAKTGADGTRYYEIPLYFYEGIAAGCPVDMVVISIPTTAPAYRYAFTDADTGKKITVFNANDGFNNLYIYSNGNSIQMVGGSIGEWSYLKDLLTPAPPATRVGRGWIPHTFRDNNWS